MTRGSLPRLTLCRQDSQRCRRQGRGVVSPEDLVPFEICGCRPSWLAPCGPLLQASDPMGCYGEVKERRFKGALGIFPGPWPPTPSLRIRMGTPGRRNGSGVGGPRVLTSPQPPIPNPRFQWSHARAQRRISFEDRRLSLVGMLGAPRLVWTGGSSARGPLYMKSR